MKNFISLIHNESDKITNVVAVDAISTIIDINDSETGLFLYSKIKLMGGNTFMVNQNCQQILDLLKSIYNQQYTTINLTLFTEKSKIPQEIVSLFY